MEAFSLLKYWRGGGGGGSVTLDGGSSARTTTATATTTIVTAVSQNTAESDEDDNDNDDGPFFDLEFTVPEDDEQVKQEDDGNNNSAYSVDEDGDGDNIDSEVTEDEDENEREFKFTLSSGSSGDRTDPNVSLSPSDDLFFKGRLVPMEQSSTVLNCSEPNSKSQFPVSLLKSATKFRVLMLKFKKLKSNTTEKTENDCSASATLKQQDQQPESQQQPQQQQNQPQNKFFTVKFKVEEVPIVSLFTRDSSSRVCNKVEKQSSDETISDEKRFSKDVMQRYLKMVKPLYIRVSRRYGEKLKLSGQLSLGSSGGTKAVPLPPPSTAPQKSPPVKLTAAKTEPQPPEVQVSEALPPSYLKSQKQVNLPAGLRVVCKHLGKSRSASSPAVASAPTQSKRRDDSLLQQQDGIQSAILHCKRSFNASRDLESSSLSRSVSDPSHEKSVNVAKDSSAEEGALRLACV